MRSKTRFGSLTALLLLSILVGCATVSKEQMAIKTRDFVLPQQPKQEVALVYILRSTGAGGLVRFNVFIDNPEKAEMEAGFTRGKQHIYFYLSPGKHTLYSVAENTAEGTLDFEAGKTYYIQQIPSMGFFFARNQLKVLDDVEGKYLLQETAASPGEIKRTSFP